jgi:hypothetical protein
MEQRDRANSLSSDDDVAAELSQRAAVIARKVWFLRHAQQCRDPSRCPRAHARLRRLPGPGAGLPGARLPPGRAIVTSSSELPPRVLRGLREG